MIKTVQCHACMEHVLPVTGLVTIMQHQDALVGFVRGFTLSKAITRCPNPRCQEILTR